MKYECLKVFGNIKTSAVLVLLFILSIFMAMQNKTVMFEGYKSNVYKYYMDILEGEYTKEKHDYVMEEYERLKTHIANKDLYDEQYKKNLISSTEYRELSSAAELAKSSLKTFEYIVMKTEYYAQCEKTPSYFYDVDIEDYIVNMSVNIPLLLSLILIISTLYNEDYVANTVHMIRSSKYGKSSLFWRRIYLVICISIICGFLFYTGEFVVKYLYMDLGLLDSNVISIMGMKDAGVEGSILMYLIISLILRIIYTVIVSLFICVIATVVHKYIMTFAFTLGVIYIPAVFTDSVFVITKGLEVYPMFINDQNVHGVPDVLVAIMMYILILCMIIGAMLKREKIYYV